MKIVLIAMLFTVSAFGQSPAPQIARACGPQNVNFDVKLDKSQHTIVQPEPGKAEAYFIQDRGPAVFGMGQAATSLIGIDGAWMGENKNNSYFAVPVEPGEHHVCTNALLWGNPTELTHFTAEPGKIYFFRERLVPIPAAGLNLFIELVDSDEAEYLIASYPLSVSHQKK